MNQAPVANNFNFDPSAYEQPMGVIDVIAEDARRNNKRPAAVLTGVMIAVDKRKAKLFHDNKTVVILDPISGNKPEYEAHLFTADQPSGVKKSAQALFDKVRAEPGIQKIYASLSNPKLVDLARAVGANVQQSDKKGYNWMTEL